MPRDSTPSMSRDGSAWALGASWMSLVKCVVLPKGPETERSSVRAVSYTHLTLPTKA